MFWFLIDTVIHNIDHSVQSTSKRKIERARESQVPRPAGSNSGWQAIEDLGRCISEFYSVRDSFSLVYFLGEPEIYVLKAEFFFLGIRKSSDFQRICLLCFMENY